MHEIICRDETFDPNFTIEYKLSIQVGLGGFSFSILDDIRKKILVFQHFPYNFKSQSFLARKAKEIVQKTEILQNKYKSVTVFFETQLCTLVPSVQEYPNKPEELLKLSHDIPANNSLGSLSIDSFECLLFYSYPEKLKSFFEDTYPNCIFTHQIQSAFNRLTKIINNKSNQVNVTVGNNYFNLIITKGKQVLYFNFFNYQTEHDLMYFLLSTIKSLLLKPEDISLLLTGRIKEESTLHKLLKDHFPKLRFGSLNKDYHYSYTLESIPQHQFLSVINPEG